MSAKRLAKMRSLQLRANLFAFLILIFYMVMQTTKLINNENYQP